MNYLVYYAARKVLLIFLFFAPLRACLHCTNQSCAIKTLKSCLMTLLHVIKIFVSYFKRFLRKCALSPSLMGAKKGPDGRIFGLGSRRKKALKEGGGQKIVPLLRLEGVLCHVGSMARATITRSEIKRLLLHYCKVLMIGDIKTSLSFSFSFFLVGYYIMAAIVCRLLPS